MNADKLTCELKKNKLVLTMTPSSTLSNPFLQSFYVLFWYTMQRCHVKSFSLVELKNSSECKKMDSRGLKVSANLIPKNTGSKLCQYLVKPSILKWCHQGRLHKNFHDNVTPAEKIFTGFYWIPDKINQVSLLFSIPNPNSLYTIYCRKGFYKKISKLHMHYWEYFLWNASPII